MPLRIAPGIPIRVMKFSAAPHVVNAESLESFETALDNLSLQPNNPLPITSVIQKESLWCWAACAEMVTGFLQTPHEQCEVVTHFPGNKPEGDPCQQSHVFRNVGCDISQMNTVWQLLKVNFKLVQTPPQPGVPALPFDALKNEINAGRPIEVGVAWHGGLSGHAMLVKGYGEIDGRDSVWINDPLGAKTRFGPDVKGGEGQVFFRELMEANGYGVWVCSWINLARS